MDISAFHVASAMMLAGIGWLAFAISQSGRWHSYVLLWLCIPFILVAVIFIYIGIRQPTLEEMRIYVRWGFISIGLSQGIVLLLLAYIEWKLGEQH